MRHKRGNLKSASGTGRQQRFPPALDPAYAPVDERTRFDDMSFAMEFAKLISYYDESNEPAGNWTAFFERDLAFLLASIITSDIEREHFYMEALQTATREGRENIRETLKLIYHGVRRIDNWYRRATDIAKKDLENNTLRVTLQTIIQSDLAQYLGDNVNHLLKSLPQSSEAETWSSYWQRRESQLHEIWRTPLPDAPTYAPVVYHKPMDGLFAILQGLHQTNHKLRDVARQYLEDTLKRSNHAPHTALYIAFVKLLEIVRGKINTLTARHLDFYYRDVLRLTERGSAPDVVHLSFEAAPQVNGYMLPAGTRLAAGKDPSGAVRQFSTDADLFINRARVGSIKALYLAEDRLATSTHAPQRVLNIFALPQNNSEDGMGAPLMNPAGGWPTFGINETSNSPTQRSQLNADLGFILSSSVLLLQEGERNVTVSIAFQGESSLEAALQKYQDVANDILDEPPPLELLLADALLVSVSGATGWISITNASFRRHPVVGTTMEIEFTLEATAPPVIANAALAPDGQRCQWPMLKLTLNPMARIYAYSFFNELIIESIDLRVSVSGLRKMTLRNEVGLLSAAQPFAIFGPAPSQGSYLLLSHPELAVKHVNHIAMTVAWFNLPKPPANMASHYAAYNLGINDDSFQVRLSVFGSSTWVAPSNGHDLFPLFTRDFNRTGLLPATTLALEIPELAPPATVPLEAGPLTESQAPRGSIRMELASPEIGFGQSVYPRIMADAATANARAGKNDTHIPLPNPPLAPSVKSLLLEYEAADKLDLSRPLPENQAADFYSLYPFGYVGHQARATSMFADFSEQGHLYLGISEIGPRQTLTLLFQVCDAGFSPVPSLRHHHDEPVPPIRWRYLSQDEWKTFPPRLIISDSTMGLTRSGIVKFSIPEDITTENTLMPAGQCWIEAAAKRVAGEYWCQVVSIATQAATATRISHPQNDLTPAVLPAGSVTEFIEKKAQVKSISQPFASTAGRGKEHLIDFRTRVSERLRHKGRAIQSFDFERLILDEFPETGQAKCIGYNTSRTFRGTVPVKPGTLYVVVTPRLEDSPDPAPRMPQFVLKRIENFIRPLTSPFVKDIHVINPVYETLKVFVNVEFTGEGDASYFSHDLNIAISQYLQPWRQQPAQPIHIGSGQVQGYHLATFIQQQPYVRQLQKLAMLHTYQTEDGYVSDWRSIEQRVWASAPWAVLMPAAEHGIVAVDPGASAIDEGIRNLTVGNDFVMGEPSEKEKKEKTTEQRYFLVIPRNIVHQSVPD